MRPSSFRVTEATVSPWYPVDTHPVPFNLAAAVRVSAPGVSAATATQYDVEHTLINVFETTPVAGDIFAKASAQTASGEWSYAGTPIAAIRINVTAIATGGSVTLTVLQAGN